MLSRARRWQKGRCEKLATDLVVVGRGPAGLLLSSLAVQAGAAVSVVADGLGTLPLWGGQWDFRSYDTDGAPITDPYAWWRAREPHTSPPGVTRGWLAYWQHLAALWTEMGIAVNPPGPNNQWTVTPLGHLRPTYLAPSWQYTTDKPSPVIFVGVPGLTDFVPTAMARVYDWASGATAYTMMLETPPAWRETWNALNWAWFLDAPGGQEWLMRVLRGRSLPSEGPLLFPQILGVDHAQAFIAELAKTLSRRVAEVPLPPVSVGGIRVQRRWDRWLRHHAVPFISGRVHRAEPDQVVLADGRKVTARVVLATGGVLGGGLLVEADGTVRDAVTGVAVSFGEHDDLATVGYLETTGPIPVVGRMVKGWNPDQYGEGGAMILSTVHAVHQRLMRHSLETGTWR